MKMLIAAATIGTVIAGPALAQSYDPDLGTGNTSGFTAAPAYTWSVDQDAFARVVPAASRTRSARDAYNAVTPSGSPTAPQDRRRNAGSTREAALLECSTKSRQYTETTWGDMQIHQFRTCMMQHGQPE